MHRTIQGKVRRIAYVPNNSIGVVKRAPIVFYLEGDATQYTVGFVHTRCLEALHLTKVGDEISVLMGPENPIGSEVEHWVNKTFQAEQTAAEEANPKLEFVLKQGMPPDLSQVIGPIVAQTSRQEADGFYSTRGERMSGAELERRRKLSYRVLTAADIPAMDWSTDYEQYYLREDGAVVTRDRVVPWGTVTDDGRIEWASTEAPAQEA
jgi:hypothetical protein